MRRNASAALGAPAPRAGSAAGPTIAKRLATNGQASSMCPGSTSRRRSRLGACVSTTSRSPRAAAARICPDGPITVAGMGCASESSTARAPDCSTVYVVPSRSARSRVVHATSTAHISPAPSSRSLPMRRSVLVLALLSIPSIPSGAIAQVFRLTVESIMRGPDLVGTAPSNVRFSADGRYVYFSWRAPGVDTLDRDYRVAVAGASHAPERLPRFAVDTIAMADGAWARDLGREVVVLKGDLYVVEKSGAKRRLTATPAPESDPAWSADGRSVCFTRDGNAWSLGLADGALRQLTDI